MRNRPPRKLRIYKPATAEAHEWNGSDRKGGGDFLKLTGKAAIQRRIFMDEQRRLIDDQLHGRRLYR